ncbi:MAG: type IX secretion system membrane protein PorP/SprF, partial [Bacteroidetes bacterium]|nr:type IX secretion system membrane protein PorP/SprF [Bacteroidota bacterium]
MIRKLFILIIACFCLAEDSQGQDPEFSQFYAAPLYLNPAFAGMAYCPRLAFIFRDEWPGVPGDGSGSTNRGGYVTYGASYDQHFDALGGGIGVQFISDRQGGGMLNSNTVNTMYSYQLDVAKLISIKSGIEVGFTNISINWDRLVFGDQVDARYGFNDISGNANQSSQVQPDELSTSYFDFAAGALLINPNFFGGFSVKHLIRPNESISGRESRIPIRYNIHGGAVVKLDKGLKTKSEMYPNIMYTLQGDFKQLDVGSYIRRSEVFAGMWYRILTHPDFSSDALILIVGFKKDIFKLSYSYDLTVSGLTPGSGGSHEIAIGINFCDGD